jgi:hypothetical protein
MYNPVNNHVLDKERLDQYDEKEKQKKKRFEIRYDIEDFYRNKCIEDKVKKDSMLDKKLSYERYNITDHRGYDIINFKNNFGHYKNLVKTKDEGSEWETVVAGAGGTAFYYLLNR